MVKITKPWCEFLLVHQKKQKSKQNNPRAKEQCTSFLPPCFKVSSCLTKDHRGRKLQKAFHIRTDRACCVCKKPVENMKPNS